MNPIERDGDRWSYNWQTGWESSSYGKRLGRNDVETNKRMLEGLMKLAAMRGLTPEAAQDAWIDENDPHRSTFGESIKGLICEGMWLSLERPTYFITSQVREALLNTKIEGIGIELFEFPFNSLLMILPDGAYEHYPIAMVSRMDFVHPLRTEAKKSTQVWLCMQTKEALDDDRTDGWAAPNSLGIMWTDAISSFPDWTATPSMRLSRHRTEDVTQEEANLRHIAMCLVLLCTHANDELFAPLLLRKDEDRKEGKSADELAAYAAKAIRVTRRKAWFVGRNLQCPTVREAHGESDPTGRKLTSSHWRAGHFHRVRHGPQHSLVKVEWFRPTLVRPDLPAIPDKRRTYRVCSQE